MHLVGFYFKNICMCVCLLVCLFVCLLHRNRFTLFALPWVQVHLIVKLLTNV